MLPWILQLEYFSCGNVAHCVSLCVLPREGLIIDAFGELRDREESITADMKNKCFVCGLPKAEFDHIAHGFDNHITREHNTAHYM